MDNTKVGSLIRKLRKERHMTQMELAQMLHISDKTVSKWERGMGSPEISMIPALSKIFQVDMQSLLSGELNRKGLLAGNMRKAVFYVCPDCGNLVVTMAPTAITCCGRTCTPLTPTKAVDSEKLSVEIIEHDYFITSNHEMTRDHYITFVAFLTSDSVILKKLYPEWDLQTRIPVIAHGRLLWHCSRHGLFYQEV